MSQPKPHLLDVGQCSADHALIRHVITNHFEAEVDRVMFVDEAMKKLAERDYALVMVNRLVFADGSEGSQLITRMKSDAAIANVPVMLVSNYADAQQAAVAAGAVPGFGKAAAYDDETLDRLAKFLPRKSTKAKRE